MRIVSGTYKGRNIPVRKNFPSRPTTDFAKEGLFNVLSHHFNLEEISVLDLFSGTGSISYEFASRGSKVDLVEINNRSVEFIRSVIRDLKMENITVIRSDVFRIVPKLGVTYDVVFADPPYQMENISELPDLIFSSDILNKDGWFILEHSGQYSFSDSPHFHEVRKYGSVNFSIFVNN